MARRQRGYLHIKGGVPGTFEDQTSNGAVRGEVRWLAAFFCLDLEWSETAFFHIEWSIWWYKMWGTTSLQRLWLFSVSNDGTAAGQHWIFMWYLWHFLIRNYFNNPLTASKRAKIPNFCWFQRQDNGRQIKSIKVIIKSRSTKLQILWRDQTRVNSHY